MSFFRSPLLVCIIHHSRLESNPNRPPPPPPRSLPVANCFQRAARASRAICSPSGHHRRPTSKTRSYSNSPSLPHVPAPAAAWSWSFMPLDAMFSLFLCVCVCVCLCFVNSLVTYIRYTRIMYCTSNSHCTRNELILFIFLCLVLPSDSSLQLLYCTSIRTVSYPRNIKRVHRYFNEVLM